MRSPDPLTRDEKVRLTGLARDLEAWAATSGRTFPWRSADATTYEQITVEVLLQRTTAAAVGRFYEAFFSRFRDWESLSAATIDELESFLKPLGLWRRRASALTGLARYAFANGGRFPSDPLLHDDIPAVGQYVSNAILLFQHAQPAPLLDGNMARVVERFVRPRRLVDIRHDPWLQDAARWLVRGPKSRLVSWAVLDFAATVCKLGRPLCNSCPVRDRCAYFRGTGLNTSRVLRPASVARETTCR